MCVGLSVGVSMEIRMGCQAEIVCIVGMILVCGVGTGDIVLHVR